MKTNKHLSKAGVLVALMCFCAVSLLMSALDFVAVSAFAQTENLSSHVQPKPPGATGKGAGGWQGLVGRPAGEGRPLGASAPLRRLY